MIEEIDLTNTNADSFYEFVLNYNDVSDKPNIMLVDEIDSDDGASFFQIYYQEGNLFGLVVQFEQEFETFMNIAQIPASEIFEEDSGDN